MTKLNTILSVVLIIVMIVAAVAFLIPPAEEDTKEYKVTITIDSFYILDQSKMDLASPEMLVLHPLPRVNEISVDVDNDPRAAYFKQVQYGVYARMALILTLLNIKVD